MIELTGKRFGMLTVEGRAGSVSSGKGTAPTWFVLCDCGNRKVVLGMNLRHGRTQSCGCKQTKHGMYGTPEYAAWSNMLRRCRNPNAANYQYYGARGIIVCEEWETSFKKFFDHIGPRPTKNHSLDRIDNEKNYEPGNVRWATAKQQARNKSTSRFLTVRGKSASIAEWAEKVGIRKSTLRERLQRGWKPARAIFAPVR